MAVISRDDAADEERWVRYGSAPLIATLLLPIIIGVILVLKCVFHHCCIRKSTPKDEMYGLEGRMTMLSTGDSNFVTLPSSSATSALNNGSPASPIPVVAKKEMVKAVNSDAKQNFHHASTSTKVGGNVDHTSGGNELTDSSSSSSVCVDGRTAVEYRRSSGTSRLTSSQESSDLTGSLKRASAQHRQLPDLPHTPSVVSGSHPPRRSNSVVSQDGTSELYATVGETPLPDGASSKRSSHYAQIRETGKSSSPAGVSKLPSGFPNGNGPGTSSAAGVANRARGIEATPSSDSETYASSSAHHPYAKLKKNLAEHPYARVRAAGGNNNDEETDTDNYDLPQFLNSSRQGPASSGNAAAASSPPMHHHPPSSSGANPNPGGSLDVGDSTDNDGPVPPRRIGRQWRRSSQPQVLNNNDNASHFSGDSQDSRGYTSISVREPLSNIRNQVVAGTSRYDSHYATVSDDSEEMYAAIEDPNDSNYMRIPGDHDNNHPRRPTWLGGPSVSSPIPERREANSPLPPVPNVPPPESSPGPSTSSIPPPSSPITQFPLPPPQSQLQPQASTLPVYAQVSKKSKKQQGKTPVTPTTSNASVSPSQQVFREVTPPIPPIDPALMKDAHSFLPPSSHHQAQHTGPGPHRSKRAASLMDNTNPMDADSSDSRRWSKADISYSEFEVVRESLFPSAGPVIDDHPLSTRSPPGGGTSRSDTRLDTSPSIPTRRQELVDEDNYNIIPEKSTQRINTQGNSSSGSASTSSTRRRLDSGNYHEIEPRNLTNLNSTYQEIGGGKEPSDHYQEIGDRRRGDDDDGGELYQEIERKGRNSDEEEDEDEDDEEDQFYERVKKPGQQKGKKHGYEKLKKKGGESSSSSSKEKKRPPGNLSGVIPAIGSDEEDDDDEEKGDQMYERVKYPPYERLKESKDDLSDSGRNGSDHYEDIGYTRVKSKAKEQGKHERRHNHQEEESSRSEQQDVSQLYAQVDKSKKRKGATSSSATLPANVAALISNNAEHTLQDTSGNNNDPLVTLHPASTITGGDVQHLYSKVTKKTKGNNKNSHALSTSRNASVAGGGGGDVQTRITNNDNSIEYI